MKKLTPSKTKRGGARPGSGAKPFLINAVTPKVYIDATRYQGLADLGDGNFSAGVRLAHDLLKENDLLKRDKITSSKGEPHA